MVTKVISKFSKGLFTQEFTTILPNLEHLSEEGNKTNSSSATGKTGETAREGTNKSISAQDKLKDRNNQARLEAIYKGQTRAGRTANSSKSNPESTAGTLEKLKQNVRTGATVNDDQYIPKVGTFGDLGREKSQEVNINKRPAGRSIMFKDNN
jgi:hypothetical protein